MSFSHGIILVIWGRVLSSACFIKFRADGIFKHAIVLNIPSKRVHKSSKVFLKETTTIIQFQGQFTFR